MSKFFEELSRCLREGGIESSNIEDKRLEVFLHGQPVLFVSPGHDVFLLPAGSRNEEASDLYHRVAGMADEVYEYVEAVQNAPLLRASSLKDEFHLLADFGGAVLAGIELPKEWGYRDTTGFRCETLTDDPELKKSVDDILLDFAGEENPRRACNYGLTEAGKQALRDAADPSLPHTYAWYVMTDTNTPQEKIRQNLTLEEAIQIYQDSDVGEKRLGVTKDGIATVDIVHAQDGEQRFFGDHEKLESFRSDPVVEEAVEQLHQQLEQPNIGIRMGGI